MIDTNKIPIEGMVEISLGHYILPNSSIHYFNHKEDYGNNEDIIMPNGILTNSFKDVLNYA